MSRHERLAPLQESRSGLSDRAGGAAESREVLRWRGEILGVDQGVEFGDLVGRERVLDDQVAVEIEQVLLFLEVDGHRTLNLS